MSVEEMMIGSTTVKIYDDYIDTNSKNNLDRVITDFIMNIENKDVVISGKDAYNN